jgi:hypothetical protein
MKEKEEEVRLKCFEVMPALQNYYVVVNWVPQKSGYAVIICRTPESCKADPINELFVEGDIVEDCLQRGHCGALELQLDEAVESIQQ